MITHVNNVTAIVNMVITSGDIVRSLGHLRDAARAVLADGIAINWRFTDQLITLLHRAISGARNDNAEEIIGELDDIFS